MTLEEFENKLKELIDDFDYYNYSQEELLKDYDYKRLIFSWINDVEPSEDRDFLILKYSDYLK